MARIEKIKIILAVVMMLFVNQVLPQASHKQGGKHDRSAGDCEFMKGADISFLDQIEDHGVVYTENGVPKDALLILKDHGINTIRLRIWHTPSSGYNNLEKTLSMASRIKDEDFKLLLDFHYSDTWADPDHQAKPSAWSNVTFDAMKDSVFHYTRYVVTALKNQNALPDMVQIGNEIICGMLWNDGRVCGSYDVPEQWENLAGLINEGIRGVHESLDAGDSVRIMIHIDRGTDSAGCQWFFDNLLSYGVDFDVIGLSYYPWWHGPLSQVSTNLNFLAQEYGKDIVIVEAAYPWTLQWIDDTHNIVGDSSQLHAGYDASVEGQRAFLEDLMTIIEETQGNKGKGLFYWSPEHISVPELGSPWENLALFDFEGEMLSSIEAFENNVTGSITVRELPR